MKNLFIFLGVLIFSMPVFSQNNTLNFDGVDNYVTTTGFIDLSLQSFAIEGWFKADALPSAGNYPHIFGIIEAGLDAALVRINGDSHKLEFVMNSSAGLKWVTSTETIVTGVWYHAAILYHINGINDAQYLLINGQVVASQAFVHLNNYSNREFRIGGDGSRNFNGQVDDVKVWANTIRSSTDVRTSMYKEVIGNESNLIAYYKLDEASGMAANDSQSSSAYDGTLTNMTGTEWTISSAFFGPKNCLNFDGLNANVWCPNITPTVTSGTIEFWVNLDVIPEDNARLISRGANYSFGDEIYLLNNNGRIYTANFVAGDNLSSTDPLPLDVWTHVAITADGTGSKLYINGILDDTGGAAAFSFNTFRFGGQYTAGFYESIDGMMDEVRLWNDVRTESEILENMYKSLVGDEANLVAYYNLDNISGIAQSYPAEVNDGSIGGGATYLASTAFNTWLNTDDTDWATASNWSNGTPGSSDNIGVYNMSGYDPSVSSTANCNDLYLETGATLSLNDGASFINSGNLYINGDFIYNKTLTNDNKWHIVSAPNATTTANLFFGDYLQNWNESTGLWEQIDDENTTLTPVKGYGFYGTHAKASYSFTGDPNDGEQNISLTTSGSGGNFNKANAVGNPYPSSIDWDLVSGYGAKYTWNGTAYEAYPATGGFGTGPRYAAPCQGFFVLPENSGTFTLNNTMRTHNGADGFEKSIQKISNGLILFTNSADYSDKLIIAFNEDSSAEFELDKDAYKILSNTENLSQIYSISNTNKLSIDIRPEAELIQLGFQNDMNGNYSIGIEDSDGISSAELEDTKLNTFHELSQGAYEFNWNTNDSEERFILHLKATATQELEEQEAQVYSYDGQIYIRQASSMAFQSIQVIDLAGRMIYSESLNQDEIQSIHLSNSKGAYLVQLIGENISRTEKIIIK